MSLFLTKSKKYVRKYKFQSKLIMKSKQRDFKRFHLFLILMLKKPVFLLIVKIPYQRSLTFLTFTNIFISSSWQRIFKLGALTNFSIFSIKEVLQQRCFSVNIAKLLRITNFSSGCFCIILKVIKQLFSKDCF